MMLCWGELLLTAILGGQPRLPDLARSGRGFSLSEHCGFAVRFLSRWLVGLAVADLPSSSVAVGLTFGGPRRDG